MEIKRTEINPDKSLSPEELTGKQHDKENFFKLIETGIIEGVIEELEKMPEVLE